MGTEIELMLRFDDGNWLAEYTDGNFVVMEANLIGEAKTPENAACKLAIELIRQGVLSDLKPSDPEANTGQAESQ